MFGFVTRKELEKATTAFWVDKMEFQERLNKLFDRIVALEEAAQKPTKAKPKSPLAKGIAKGLKPMKPAKLKK